MQEINLLQNRVKDSHTAWKKHTKVYITILSVLLIMVVGATTALYLYNNSLQSQKDEVVQLNLDLKRKLDSNQKGMSEAKTFQAQLVNMRYLVDNHTYFSPFFEELSKMTYIKTQYTNLDLGVNGKAQVEGRVDDYNDLSKFILALTTSSKFKDVKLLSARPGTEKEGGLEFSISMTVINDIFNKK
jgi:Tfp pilus assembly protein PilN